MYNLTLAEICDILDIKVPKELIEIKDDNLSCVSYSLKHIQKDCAYFLNTNAVYGDINNSIKQILADGAKVIFLEKSQLDMIDIEWPFVLVENRFLSVVKITSYLRNKTKVKVIGVTGSLGKTTSKDFIFEVLNVEYNAIKSLGNENTLVALIKNVQKLTDETDFFVQEYGIATPNVMPLTASACIPNASVITCISDPHVDRFGSKEGILKEKLRMVELMEEGSPVFLNYDDEMLSKVNLPNYNIISFAVNNKKADYHAENIKEIGDSIEFTIVHNNNRYPAIIHVRGTQNIGNALVAFAVGEYYNIPEKTILKGISNYRPKGIRQTMVNIGGYNMYLDAYNTAPKSLVDTMHTLEKLPVKNNGRRIAIIADIAKLGDFAEELHKETGSKLSNCNVDIIYCYGNINAKYMAENINNEFTKVYYTDDREVLNNWLRENVNTNDVLMFKGPVPRLLSKTIDQVFGTSYHISSEHFEYITQGDFRFKVIYEKENHKAKTLAIVNYYGNNKELVVPAELNGIKVFSIADNSFANNDTIEKVTLPDSIKNISMNSFRGCINLNSIILPKELLYIGKSAFRDCTNLNSIVIPDKVIHIDDRAFMNCKSMTKAVIPASVNYFGDKIFYRCPNISFEHIGPKKEPYLITNNFKIKLRRNKKTKQLEARITGYIKDSADIIIPEMYKNIPIVRIANGAFSNNKKLKKLVIPSGIESIGKNAFKNCLELEYAELLSTKINIDPSAFDSKRIVFSIPKDSNAKEYLNSRNNY